MDIRTSINPNPASQAHLPFTARQCEDYNNYMNRYQALAEDEEPNTQSAFKATPVMESVFEVYGLTDDYIPLAIGWDIATEIACEKAFGAATRPDDTPCNWREAMARPDSAKWMEAAQTEINALTENGTRELVPLPANRKAIGSRWVFLIKQDGDGRIERYKARLVGQGFGQSLLRFEVLSPKVG